jgi:hypothetical protein
MKKQLTSLVALTVVLVMLFGGYVFLKNRPVETPEGPSGTVTPPEIISNIRYDKILKVVLESENGEVVMERKNKDTPWTMPGVTFRLNQSLMNELTDSFVLLRSQSVVEENPPDIEKYGLKTPAVTATAYLDDGTEKVLYLGDKTPTGNNYYLMVKGVDKVYTVVGNHGIRFSSTLNNFRDRSFGTVDINEVNYMRIKYADGRTMEITTDPKYTEKQDFKVNQLSMLQPYNSIRAVNAEKFNNAIDHLTLMKIVHFVEDNPQDLSKYGLDKPRYELYVKDSMNNLIHLLVGDDRDEEFVYIKIPGEPSVYTVDRVNMINVTLEPHDFLIKSTYMVNINQVDKIEIKDKDATTTITFDRQTKKAEKEGDEDEVITTYKIDGREIEEAAFRRLYQQIIGLIIDGDNNKSVPNDPDVTTTFYLNTGKERVVTIGYAPADQHYYAVFRDGHADFLIFRDKVNQMVTNIRNAK